MCVIVYKPIGVKIPDEAMVRHLWSKHSDGAGYCFAKDGRVIGKKGFMTADGFLNSMRRNVTKNDQAVFHFRTATRGGNLPSVTHPFPASSNINELKKLSWESYYGIAHNGTLHTYGEKASGKLSDTQDFIKQVLHDPLILLGLFSDRHAKPIQHLISKRLYSDRLIIIRGDGHVLTFGDWHEHRGMLFSNDSYKKAVTRWDKKEKDNKKKDGKESKKMPVTIYDEEGEEGPLCRGKQSKPKGKSNGNPPIGEYAKGRTQCPHCKLWVETTLHYRGVECCIGCIDDVVEEKLKITPSYRETLTPMDILGAEMDDDEVKIGEAMRRNGFIYCHAKNLWLSADDFCEQCKYMERGTKNEYVCMFIDGEGDIANLKSAMSMPVVMDENLCLLDIGGYDMLSDKAKEEVDNLYAD